MQKILITLILFVCLTNCRFSSSRYFTNYKSEKIFSPSSKYYLIATVNRTNNKKDDFADVIIHLYNAKGQPLSDFNTSAGDASKWSVGWDTKQDTVVLFSSDKGNEAYRIEDSKLKIIALTDELDKRAIELKKQEYKE